MTDVTPEITAPPIQPETSTQPAIEANEERVGLLKKIWRRIKHKVDLGKINKGLENAESVGAFSRPQPPSSPESEGTTNS